MKKINSKFLLLFFIFLLVPAINFANPHNLLPRFPEIVFDTGNTNNYLIEELTCEAFINGNIAETESLVKIKNPTNKNTSASIKFRVFYPQGKRAVTIRIDGRNFRYSNKNNQYNLSLAPNQIATFHIKARVSANYSVNAVRKAIKAQEEKKSTFASDFAKYFNTEKYGKRFMMGALVSKWGIFPFSMDKVNIKVSAPTGFIITGQDENSWNTQDNGKLATFEFSSKGISDPSYQGVILPKKDLKDYLETQEILKLLKEKNR